MTSTDHHGGYGAGPRRIVVGLSGGVDSAVAALLLKRQGHTVEAMFMRNWQDDSPYCSAEQDLADAHALCDRLKIPLRTVDFVEEYQQRVFARFLAAFGQGLTPNPDVLCNSEIKFAAFAEVALADGADLLATGHYARLAGPASRRRLLRGRDSGKDQSYFLHALTSAQLARACFPLGELQKTQVRALARQARLPVAEKKDSTGICFIGERPFREFLAQYLPCEPGDIVDPRGQVIGRHLGLATYTLGQRQGLGIGGGHGAGNEPWYVAAKEPAGNRLIAVQGHDHPLLFSHTLWARELSWIAGMAPGQRFACSAQTRYRQSPQACRVQLTGDGCQVRFDRPQRAVTPGQYVVFYDGECCLGGGIIAATDNPLDRLSPTRAGAQEQPA